MFDDFRQHGSFFEEQEEERPVEQAPIETRRQLLGMSPVQRFVISLLLLMIVCMVSAFALIVTERVLLPFLA
jgi:hypothetical protein